MLWQILQATFCIIKYLKKGILVGSNSSFSVTSLHIKLVLWKRKKRRELNEGKVGKGEEEGGGVGERRRKRYPSRLSVFDPHPNNFPSQMHKECELPALNEVTRFPHNC